MFAIVRRIHADGMPILLVEQNARVALAVSHYGYVLENGEIHLHGPAAELAANPQVHEAYLGGGTVTRMNETAWPKLADYAEQVRDIKMERRETACCR